MVSDIYNAFVMASSEALFIYSPRGIATVVNIYHVDVFDACLSSSFSAALGFINIKVFGPLTTFGE